MKKIVCFGEVMMRLAPEGYLRFLQEDKLQATFGGAEANVSVSLANYGLNPFFVSKIPANPIGDACLNSLRYFGVDTSLAVRGGPRLGIYFCEKGSNMRPSKVVYDRAGSSIASAEPSDFDWDAILNGAQWFHFTGITPAVSDQTAQITLDAVKKCREKGITVSCDLNYRKNLWSREKAGQVMGEIVKYVDVLIANEEDSADVFGIHAASTNIESGKLDEEGYKSVARQLVERFGCKYIAITLRESFSANHNDWSGLLYSAKEDRFFKSKKYSIKNIVDRVGGGDSFGAGLIYGMNSGMDDQQTVEFAVAASALKHTIEGDYNRATVAEVKNLMGGSVSGRVQR